MKVVAILLWLMLPIGGYAVYLVYGTPHLVWGYRFLANGDPYNPFAARTYTSCSYLGWGPNTVTVPAIAARCPWLRFFKGADQ